MTPDFPELAAIRLGYGLSPKAPPPDSLDAVLASVAGASKQDGFTAQAAVDAQAELADARKLLDAGTLSKEEYRPLVKRMDDFRFIGLQHRMARAASAEVGFGERLVQFWADHFTVVPKNPMQQMMATAYVDEAIRPNIGGKFGDLLFAAATHPMMLIYLDQNTSVGPNSKHVRARIQKDPEKAKTMGLNENLARELLELHTLGSNGGYSQTDVRELAELLTGLVFHGKSPGNFRPQLVEPGAETVLGKSYGGRRTDGIDAIKSALHDLAIHPATAKHIARKLCVHFFADQPPESLVDDVAATWRSSKGDLPQVYALICGHPALAETFRAKARQPMDYLASCLRVLGVGRRQILDMDRGTANLVLAQPLVKMGQPFQRARGPDGFPEAADEWITPQMLSARIEWSLRIPSRIVEPLPDPREFLVTALGTTASEALARSVPRAESAREGVAIVLASTDFNRR